MVCQWASLEAARSMKARSVPGAAGFGVESYLPIEDIAATFTKRVARDGR